MGVIIPKPRTLRTYKIDRRVHAMLQTYFAVSRRPSRHLEIQVGRRIFTTEPK